MKKIPAVFAACFALFFLAEGAFAQKASALPDVKSEELKKLEAVYGKMSPRFREDVQLQRLTAEEKKSFFWDLQNLLAEEKTFRSDDVSLFYLMDKKHNIGSSYVPKDLVPLTKNGLFNINRNDLSLRPEAYEALKEMSVAAKKDGITLLVSSTYRSYEYQKNLFQRWVRIDGLEEAERESAREGTSQHQLGTAVDFGSITDDFDKTAMGQWVYRHAAEYGWSLSFPRQYEDVTGYRWECWHFRYLGKNACAMQKKWFKDIQQYMLEFLDAWKQ